MKRLVLIPIAVAVAAALGLTMCMAAGWAVHPAALAVAAVAVVLSAAAGALPAILLRRADQATIAQAALGGSVLHMLLSLALVGAGYAARLAELTPLALWTAALYWASLAALAIVLAGRVRSAAPATKAGG